MYDIKYAIKCLKKDLPEQEKNYTECDETDRYFVFGSSAGGLQPYLVDKQTGEHKWVMFNKLPMEVYCDDKIIKEYNKKELETIRAR